VDAALRLLPSRGWTPGLFGRRDRCLLVLSQLARIQHKHLATLTAGDITLTDGAATITTSGQTSTLHAVEDPVLCGPCSIARWLHTHQVIVTKIATRAIADHLDEATPLTSQSSHVCRETFSVDDRAASEPLLAPVTQWGHAPFPLNPMTPPAVSRQARDLLGGIVTVHRVLPVHRPTVEENTPPAQPEAAAAGYPMERRQAAWDRRRADLANLADVADELAAVDRRAADLTRRITDLLALATS
jgi:hypothetical protein